MRQPLTCPTCRAPVTGARATVDDPWKYYDESGRRHSCDDPKTDTSQSERPTWIASWRSVPLAHCSSSLRDTEVAAALSQDIPAGCARALGMIREAGSRGLTDLEGQDSYYSFPKRRCDLLHAGLVRDSGRTRPTPRGAEATVWEVAS